MEGLLKPTVLNPVLLVPHSADLGWSERVFVSGTFLHKKSKVAGLGTTL